MQQPPVDLEREGGNEPGEDDDDIGKHGPIGTNAVHPGTIEGQDPPPQSALIA